MDGPDALYDFTITRGNVDLARDVLHMHGISDYHLVESPGGIRVLAYDPGAHHAGAIVTLLDQWHARLASYGRGTGEFLGTTADSVKASTRVKSQAYLLDKTFRHTGAANLTRRRPGTAYLLVVPAGVAAGIALRSCDRRGK